MVEGGGKPGLAVVACRQLKNISNLKKNFGGVRGGEI
jgi:hypothetical protein